MWDLKIKFYDLAQLIVQYPGIPWFLQADLFSQKVLCIALNIIQNNKITLKL